MDSIASEHRGVTIELIHYHTWWPGSADDFYTYNIPENRARVNYYSVNYVPWLNVDGTQVGTGSAGDIWGPVEARLMTPSPLEIAVSDTLIGDSTYVTAQVIATGDVDAKATLTFQCAVVEDWHKAHMIKFYYMMRDMVPDAAGESFTISQGDTLTFERVWWWDPDVYRAGRMKTLVFVQNDATKEIINSASTAPKPEHFAWYMSGDVNETIPPDSSGTFLSTAYNLGTVPDTFDVNIAATVPPGWSVSYTTSQGTFSGASQIFLGPGEEETILVNADPANNPGYTKIQTTVTGPVWDDVMARPRYFNAIHDVDVLLVDDDGASPFEGYYQAALDSTGLVHGTWDRSGESISTADFGQAGAVVWMTGLSEPTLTLGDRNALKAYLLAGGNAFVTGQDIGWSLCDLSSPNWSPNGSSWYQTYLGAVYIGDNANSDDVYGVVSDPISDGMSFAIAGGDGADNQVTEDLIQANGSAVPIFYYDEGDTLTAAVRFDSSGTFKTVYLAFGFEAIDNAQGRADLMRQIMDWFGLFNTTDVAETEELARTPRLAQNVPNPFNPETAIGFSIPARGRVRLNVYNVQGQLIQVLQDGVMEAGEHSLHWDGMDRNGNPVASGLYFYALETGTFAESKKMILLR